MSSENEAENEVNYENEVYQEQDSLTKEVRKYR